MTDRGGGLGQRKAPGKPEYISPAKLAELVGPLKGNARRKRQNCSQRTVREWCKKGLISEAYQTKGGHWRIRMPLSGKTLRELEMRDRDSPFYKNARYKRSKDVRIKGFHGNWAPELAESLLLAQIYQVDSLEGVPAPTLAELEDLLDEGLIEEPTDEKAKAARRIQDEIIRRLETGKPFWDLLVKGWVYQLWLENQQRLPTVEQVAEVMGLSRPALYYRGYNAKKLAKDYRTACDQLKRDLPDLDGLDPVQRRSLMAKKRGFGSIDRDPFADD